MRATLLGLVLLLGTAQAALAGDLVTVVQVNMTSAKVQGYTVGGSMDNPPQTTEFMSCAIDAAGALSFNDALRAVGNGDIVASRIPNDGNCAGVTFSVVGS